MIICYLQVTEHELVLFSFGFQDWLQLFQLDLHLMHSDLRIL